MRHIYQVKTILVQNLSLHYILPFKRLGTVRFFYFFFDEVSQKNSKEYYERLLQFYSKLLFFFYDFPGNV